MFNKNKEKITADNTSETVADRSIGRDFITHNMPESRLFSGQTFSEHRAATAESGVIIPEAGDNRKIGLAIIIGGVVLIIALLFLGYYYFIKPNIKQPATTTKEMSEITTATTTNSAAGTATSTTNLPLQTIATDTPLVATSTALAASSTAPATASSSTMMPEETALASTTATVSTVDTDADGLTDDEEKIVGTDPEKADTDNDGYADLAELESGYDPLVPGKKISSSSKMQLYAIDSRATVLYPSDWSPTRNAANSVVVFADADKAFIQVIYQDNPKKLDPNTWFNEQFTGLTPGETIDTKYAQGFFSKDGLAAYVFSRDLKRVYSFSCSPLAANTSSVTLFHLMIKTLVIK